MALGLLGKKIGMSQLNDEKKGRIAVTLLEVGPCLVMQKKTPERDGYSALKLAFGPRRAKSTPKALKADFEKIKATPRRMIREFRIAAEELGKFEVGQEINISDVFKAGQMVDVAGTTKGRGFAGVVVRWGMKGNRRTHGTHEFFRHGGSIGTRTTPGWVHKNKKMPGHLGVERVTTPQLQIVNIVPEENCLIVSGNVPGANSGFIEIRPAR